MRTQRIGRDDLLSSIRKAGVADISTVLAVVLAPEGSLNVIAGEVFPPQSRSTLVDLQGAGAAGPALERLIGGASHR